MKKVLVTSLVLLSLSQASDICELIGGASIVAHDGTYLGRISSESVLNEDSNYGSQYSDTSIWNQYGTYGGQYSDLSPFNKYTSTPPLLMKNGKAIAHLTTNKFVEAPVNPYILKTCSYY